nr:DUF1413 domain-containing protein [Staphylococcus epidermidis]
MSFYERVLKLSENNHRTSFEFRFEELFSEEEWCALSLAERQEQEKAFRCEVNKRDDIRISFSSENDAKNKLFNIVYAYNSVKKNFKQAEHSRNPRGRNV